MPKNKITLLISGKLGFNLLVKLFGQFEIECIATDKGSADIISFAQEKKIQLFIGNPRGGRLSDFIGEPESELLLSINYLFLVDKALINKFKYPVNFHGSLLPKYRGRTPHVWAIINNEKETGITAHFIDSECDTGDVLLQLKVPIEEEDTGSSILEKYIELYPVVISKVVIMYQSGSLIAQKQDNRFATIYRKRTPDDGRINWDWHKERIRNWVRAQANPYPGAFTYYGDIKVIIDKVSYSPIGFDNNIANGTILQVSPELIVKTSNGAIKIEEIRTVIPELIINKTFS